MLVININAAAPCLNVEFKVNSEKIPEGMVTKIKPDLIRDRSNEILYQVEPKSRDNHVWAAIQGFRLAKPLAKRFIISVGDWVETEGLRGRWSVRRYPAINVFGKYLYDEKGKPVISFMKGLFHSQQHGRMLGSEVATGLRAFVQPSSAQVRIWKLGRVAVFP